jgi:hypothetical protein
MPTSLQGFENVFHGANGAKVAQLERQTRQIAASIEFLQAAQNREQAVKNADWGSLQAGSR